MTPSDALLWLREIDWRKGIPFALAAIQGYEGSVTDPTIRKALDDVVDLLTGLQAPNQGQSPSQ